MGSGKGRPVVLAASLAVAALLAPTHGRRATAAEEEVVSFGFTGAPQTWTVPAGVVEARFDLAGARGGRGLNPVQQAAGARVVATIAVTPGETLQINVGGVGGISQTPADFDAPGAGLGGWNGGGDGGSTLGDLRGSYRAPGGGGASDVRRDPLQGYGLGARVLVAGGGGGHSYYWYHTDVPARGLGGIGGATQGVDGIDGKSGGAGSCVVVSGGAVMGADPGTGIGGEGGRGGRSDSGGAGGAAGDATGDGGSNFQGQSGAFGVGGRGGDAFACNGFTDDPGGGGGGGWYGGGGGGGATAGNSGGGGGGGSSFAPLGAEILPGTNAGNGFVRITYTPGVTAGAAHQPDLRVGVGAAGALVGDDIYGTLGAGQASGDATAPGGTIVFRVSVQNDGSATEKLTVAATGAAVPGFRIKYLRGKKNVTKAVSKGRWKTPLLAPGEEVTLTVRIKLKRSVAPASTVFRDISATSSADGTKDVVQLRGSSQ